MLKKIALVGLGMLLAPVGAIADEANVSTKSEASVSKTDVDTSHGEVTREENRSAVGTFHSEQGATGARAAEVRKNTESHSEKGVVHDHDAITGDHDHKSSSTVKSKNSIETDDGDVNVKKEEKMKKESSVEVDD